VESRAHGAPSVGSLPGVWIGTALTPYVPVAGLRHGLGVVLAAAALGVLSKAGVSVSPLAIVGVPALLGLLSFVVHRRRAAARAGARRRDGRAPAPAADRLTPRAS
jgi:hypothetical protein